jgi:hypothetical protein
MKNLYKNNIDDEWDNFLTNNDDDDEVVEEKKVGLLVERKEGTIDLSEMMMEEKCPKAGDIYISTKTKIAYLNQEINLNTLFWNIPVIAYGLPQEGVVKKQMKFNSLLQEELEQIQEHLKNENHYEEYVLMNINNPTGRIKFKDIRKISVGISKKDLLSYRCKKKSAFYNCFVLILRVLVQDTFREFHVKIFNTGKMEIPGIQCETIFQRILLKIIDLLQPHLQEKLVYRLDSTENVLINSNFNCGFYINREKFYDILKYKYKIQCIYDPCSYPGIQCKYYYDNDQSIHNGMDTGMTLDEKKASPLDEKKASPFDEKKASPVDEKKASEVSFMIFRTGSILIVGKCDETILYKMYDYLNSILKAEHKEIAVDEREKPEEDQEKDKKKKLRKKQIIIQS